VLGRLPLTHTLNVVAATGDISQNGDCRHSASVFDAFTGDIFAE
jgi:hypothetical protein